MALPAPYPILRLCPKALLFPSPALRTTLLDIREEWMAAGGAGNTSWPSGGRQDGADRRLEATAKIEAPSRRPEGGSWERESEKQRKQAGNAATQPPEIAWWTAEEAKTWSVWPQSRTMPSSWQPGLAPSRQENLEPRSCKVLKGLKPHEGWTLTGLCRSTLLPINSELVHTETSYCITQSAGQKRQCVCRYARSWISMQTLMAKKIRGFEP